MQYNLYSSRNKLKDSKCGRMRGHFVWNLHSHIRMLSYLHLIVMWIDEICHLFIQDLKMKTSFYIQHLFGRCPDPIFVFNLKILKINCTNSYDLQFKKGYPNQLNTFICRCFPNSRISQIFYKEGAAHPVNSCRIMKYIFRNTDAVNLIFSL
jgi:hypothetical protein